MFYEIIIIVYFVLVHGLIALKKSKLLALNVKPKLLSRIIVSLFLMKI